MVILRGCVRCGGDILTGDARNVRCLQCGHRPEAPIAELRQRGRRAKSGGISKSVDLGAILAALDVPADAREGFVSAGEAMGDADDADSGAACPRCDVRDSIALEKLRPHFNTCFRCRLCGHIFSPGGSPAGFREAS